MDSTRQEACLDNIFINVSHDRVGKVGVLQTNFSDHNDSGTATEKCYTLLKTLYQYVSVSFARKI